MIFVCYLLAILIPNIGDAISLTGATINPFIGFIFPIMFFLKLKKTETSRDPHKLGCIAIMICISVVSMFNFATQIVHVFNL